MAQCTLDLSHPYFLKAVGDLEDDSAFTEGLKTLKKKVEAEHTCCHHVVQPMKGYPDCHGKIWKYDWSPQGDLSANRKSWRIVVIVPEPTVKPYRLIAAAVYAKNKTDQLSAKQLAKILAAVTSTAASLTEQAQTELFRHFTQDDGATRSLCMGCGETVAVSVINQVIEEGEKQHSCAGNQLELWTETKRS